MFPHVCMCLCKEHAYRPQHTDGRLIKQLIKARALGSEMRLLLFGKNCSTHHKKEGEGRTGRVGGEKESSRERERESIRANGQECVKVCPVAPPPQSNPSTPLSCALTLFLFLYLCVWLCPCLTVIKTSGNSSNLKQS